MRKLISTLAVVSVASYMNASAQHAHHPAAFVDTVEVINNPAADADYVYRVFIENAPVSFQYSGLPRFAIVGKDKSFYLGIGGTFKSTVSFDWGHPLDNPVDFIPSAIPITAEPGNGGLMQFSAATSGLFTNFVAMPGMADQFGVYFNFNLSGDNGHYGFSVSQAYMKYRGFLVGYTTGLFADNAACPPTIDFQGPNGFACAWNTVVDYTRQVSDKIKLGVGVEAPMASITTGNRVASVNQRIPDIPAYIQCGSSSNFVRFSAILRNISYRNEFLEKNGTATGWGLKVSGTSAIASSPLRVYWQGAFGRGIASYFQDTNGLGLDLVPDADDEGRVKAVKVWGGFAGLQYNFTPRCFATATYSMVRTYSDDCAMPADQYRYGQYFVTNIFWRVGKYLNMGAEYLYGRRMDYDHAQAHDNRLQAMVQINF